MQPVDMTVAFILTEPPLNDMIQKEIRGLLLLN